MRILIVDDSELMRRGIRSLLGKRTDWLVCGEAKDGLEATEKARELRPDVVLMDLSMPRMGGAEAIRILRAEFPDTAVIIVSQNDPDVLRRHAAELGAYGYIAKGDLTRDLVDMVERVGGNDRSLPDSFYLSRSVRAVEDGRGVSADRKVAGGERVQKGLAEAWSSVLTGAGPRDHIVQLYQDQQFLNRAVCRFAAAAIANGEGVILIPTIAHWDAFKSRLKDEVDVKAAEERGQLTIVNADEFLPAFLRDGMPDSPVFLALAANVVSRARGEGRYPKVRCWGEMVSLLWERGDIAASMNLEDLFDQLAQQQNMAVFCSFLMDNFDGEVHARILPRLGENHSHLIPVEDYAGLERAVTDALRETVGPDESRVLEVELLLRFPGPFHMPRSQALLLALRQTLPLVADDVLRRSRTLYQAPH
jgi:CheY-like chemotaxis protein